MIDRRDFLKTAALGAIGTGALGLGGASCAPGPGGPVVASTWTFGMRANAAAWKRLSDGAPALDAAIDGVAVIEADPDIDTVGLGGLPDSDGVVTLDACVMDAHGDAGSVAGLQDVVHAAAVARAVMERTPHVMLVGDGARRFALDQGFPEQELLTPKAEAAWRRWRAEDGVFRSEANVEAHDTIGLVALDAHGDLSGVCTTSGMKWKMPGRVGDSPIIGAALFVDNAVGAACATGVGEAVMRTCGSFLVVENMRRGMDPEAACRDALQRIIDIYPLSPELQVGYVALRRDGAVGGCAIQSGFSYAVRDGARDEMVPAPGMG